MSISSQLKNTNWKNVAIGIGIGVLLMAVAALAFYIATILLPQLRYREMDRRLDEHERWLIEQGYQLPIPQPAQ